MIKRTITVISMACWSLVLCAQTIDVTGTTVKTIDGREIHLADIIGKKPVYFKFWASWCVPCRQQMPHLQHTFETYGKDIEVLAINLNINDNLAAIKKTQKEFGLTMPIIQDEDGLLAQTYGLKVTPYHVLLNRQGKVIHTGYKVNDALNSKLAALAHASSSAFEEIHLDDGISQTDKSLLKNNKPTVLFFTSAWCDWYLQDSRPAMSAECIRAQQQVNTLSLQFPEFQWQGVVSRLWTGEKELNDYKKKYHVPFDMKVDTSNDWFFSFRVNTFPTLIAIQQGKEMFRTVSFSDPDKLTKQLTELQGQVKRD
jgi:thiol-disulfide isomerase/thioredoxin